MKDYLIHELRKSGSEVGEFLAQEVNVKSQKNDSKARSQAFLERKQEQRDLKA